MICLNKDINLKLICLAILTILLFSGFVPTVSSFYTKTENISKDFNDQLFDLKIKSLMKLGRFPSLSACIIKDNEIVWYEGYGYSNILKRQRPTIDTAYQIGSISKTFLGTAMMQLYERGLFDLDDDVNDYLDFNVRNPNYPDMPITFRMLLAHQSSIAGHTIHETGLLSSLDLYIFIIFMKDKSNYPYPQIKELLTPSGKLYRENVWLDIAPGSDSSYSNLGMILLEHLLEKMSAQKYSDYVKENIFEPLQMNNTSIYFDDFNRDKIAIPYFTAGFIQVPIPLFDFNYGPGGVKSSIKDMSHYVIAHMNGGVWNDIRILNESTVEEMHTIQYPDSVWQGERFGLGWVDWDEVDGFNYHGHIGDGQGCSACMLINHSNDHAAILLLNKYADQKRPFVINSFMKLQDTILIKAIDL